MIQDYT